MSPRNAPPVGVSQAIVSRLVSPALNQFPMYTKIMEEAPSRTAGLCSIFKQPSFTSHFAVDEPNPSVWDFEGVYLRPGDRFYMCPNIPHVVYTTAHSIVHGGHFYATSPDFNKLPGHLLDVRTWNGVLDFINMCSLAILFNVLDPRTYQLPPSSDEVDEARYDQYDLNTIPTSDRRRFVFARGLVRQLIEWLGAKFLMKVENAAADSPTISCLEFFRWQLIHYGLYLVEYQRGLDNEDGSDEEDEDNDIPPGVPKRLSELPKLTNENLKKQIEWEICTIPGITDDAWHSALKAEKQINFTFNDEQNRYSPFLALSQPHSQQSRWRRRTRSMHWV
ncbi:hypothetical protein CPB84DRAFT_1751653 [Gymnopilus junonius]|uniref:JmjC domain-containing protein n=1 Tax=Gymnopilus junonius TaxID=109634 RepID=A0A9P5NDR3_GYMJU|nr:hypothetical protein CPB84DRAFT_1751653 [Gymnopilus junonius]